MIYANRIAMNPQDMRMFLAVLDLDVSMNKKVSELTGSDLDRAVAICEGKKTIETAYAVDGVIVFQGSFDGYEYGLQYNPSTKWSDGGPIIDREHIQISPDGEHGEWVARVYLENVGHWHLGVGDTPLVAAMRCYVFSKLGGEVSCRDI
ncbi:MAG: DUF2591 domain-containing protein [Gammaproteobacteria bacterium]